MGKHKKQQTGRPWYVRVEESYHIKEKKEREHKMSEREEKPERAQNGTAGEKPGEEETNEKIQDYGQVLLDEGKGEEKGKIYLLSIIGEIEGHENLNANSKTTKYEHVLPKLAQIEDSRDIDGVLLLINTQGGDVSCGLALAEMVASLSKPTVSLIIGDSHSIGVPLAVSADDSFIVPTASMLIHPVRMTGMTIGAPQTYHYFQRIQDRITGFIADHSKVPQDKIEEMMMNTRDLTKDLGTLLVGEDTVKIGLIHEVGGIDRALKRLHEMIDEEKGLR